VPIGQPLAEFFTAGVNAAGVLAGLLPRLPVPPGLKVQAVRMTSGATVAAQTAENAAVSETDPAFGLVDTPIEVAAGLVDVSRQLVDRSQPNVLDVALATDLGAALAARVDTALLRGTGTSGQTTGLASVSGITSLTHDDASPTQAKAIKKIFELVAAVATADGSDPSHVLLAPRRLAWLLGDGAVAQSIATSKVAFVAVPSISLVLGAGTNQDEVFVINAPRLGVALDDPVLGAHGDPLSSTLTVRYVAEQTVGSVAGRRPTAIGKSNGSMWVSPAWA
jgi:Phage capsid family